MYTHHAGNYILSRRSSQSRKRRVPVASARSLRWRVVVFNEWPKLGLSNYCADISQADKCCNLGATRSCTKCFPPMFLHLNETSCGGPRYICGGVNLFPDPSNYHHFLLNKREAMTYAFIPSLGSTAASPDFKFRSRYASKLTL